jgi:hypothetical protein
MALDLANLVIEHATGGQRTRVANDLLICGREFIYACFRAELTKAVWGTPRRDSYVSWYEEYAELNDDARAAIMDIRVIEGKDNKGPAFALSDSFGQLNFDLRTLYDVQTQLGATCAELRASATRDET